jgi:hypothetical protein
MRNITILTFSSFLILSLLNFCCENSTEPNNDIIAKPVVKLSSTNYNPQSFMDVFPDTASLTIISKAYSNHYSKEIKERLIDYMKSEVSRLNEDPAEFTNILSLSGCNGTGEFVLPTYAEKAFYENQKAWVVQITYGLGGPSFGHFKCFVFGSANLDTLNYIGSR